MKSSGVWKLVQALEAVRSIPFPSSVAASSASGFGDSETDEALGAAESVSVPVAGPGEGKETADSAPQPEHCSGHDSVRGSGSGSGSGSSCAAADPVSSPEDQVGNVAVPRPPLSVDVGVCPTCGDATALPQVRCPHCEVRHCGWCSPLTMCPGCGSGHCALGSPLLPCSGSDAGTLGCHGTVCAVCAAATCTQCGGVVCGACLGHCAACGSLACASCDATCAGCRRRYCRACSPPRCLGCGLVATCECAVVEQVAFRRCEAQCGAAVCALCEGAVQEWEEAPLGHDCLHCGLFACARCVGGPADAALTCEAAGTAPSAEAATRPLGPPGRHVWRGVGEGGAKVEQEGGEVQVQACALGGGGTTPGFVVPGDRRTFKRPRVVRK
jgi:hypothetical protein